MTTTSSLWLDTLDELKSYFVKPRVFLQALLLNGVISVIFFLMSYYLGNYSATLLPAAAATILLWTLADATITNQLVFDKVKAAEELKRSGTLKHFMLVKNLALVCLSMPLVAFFGLILVGIVGKWTELLYGAVMAFVLIWGWLGISNALSVLLPFEPKSFNQYRTNKRIWVSYAILYGLPWVMLPVYGFTITLPFVLLGWTASNAAQDHRLLALAMLSALSLALWLTGLYIAEKYARHPKSKVKRLVHQ